MSLPSLRGDNRPLATPEDARKQPPGPDGRIPGRLLLGFRRDPIRFLMNQVRDYGEFVHFRIGRRDVYLVTEPDLIHEVLVRQNRVFVKREGKGKSIRGEGLLTTASDFSLRNRPLTSPSFHREQLTGYAQSIVECYDKESRRWNDGQVLDTHKAMLRLTLLIIGRTLFDSDLDKNADDIGRSMATFLEFFSRSTMPLAAYIERLPLPSNRNFFEARKKLDAVVYEMIADARASKGDKRSLMSRLVSAQTNGMPMTDSQIRDEALTILLAGHETTGNALTWTWDQLSKHPVVETKLHEEVDRVLQGGPLTLDDLQKLEYTEMVFNEALRLFPPAWLMIRQAREQSTLDGYQIMKGSLILISQYITHRNPVFFPHPEVFDPERWTRDGRAKLPRFAFFPFGGGPRTCIGEPLARLEGILLIAAIAKHWRLKSMDESVVTPQPHITLRPKGGLVMRLERRTT